MRRHALYAASLCVLVAAGCDDEMPQPQSTACGELVCASGGKADILAGIDTTIAVDQNVAWTLRIGEGTKQSAGTGRVRVGFFGSELPLADGGSLSPSTPSFLQPAVVAITLPSFDDPQRLETLEFFALLQSWDGETYSLDPVDGQGSLISTSLPDAVQLFNAAYDASTRTADRLAAVDAKLAFAALSFTTGSAGDLEVERISAVFAESSGDTRRRERLTTGRISALQGTPGDAETLLVSDGPVVREQFTNAEYMIVPGTLQRLDVGDLREAADVAGVHSFDASRTVGVFERDGVFAMAELQTASGLNPFIAWLGIYQSNTELDPIGPNPPAVLVDRTLPFFALALADLRDGVGFVEVDFLR